MCKLLLAIALYGKGYMLLECSKHNYELYKGNKGDYIYERSFTSKQEFLDWLREKLTGEKNA